MKKLALALALIVGAVTVHAASFGSPTLINAPGQTQVVKGATVVQTLVIGKVGADDSIQIYDSATLVTKAAQLKFIIPCSLSISQTTGARVININSAFVNGVVISGALLTTTITATVVSVPNN